MHDLKENMNAIEEAVRVLRAEAHAIEETARRIEAGPQGKAIQDALDILNDALNRGGKIVVTGLGKSGKVAQKIAATMNSTGSFAVYLHPTEGLHGDLGVVTLNDAVLALSQTGNTDDIVNLLPSLKSRKIKLIAMSGNSQSRLAMLSDVWIDTRVDQEACPHNLAPTTSTTLALALGDAIAVTLMQLRGFDAQAFALNHPGGALGRRLTLSVSEIMKKGDALATVLPHELMDQVVNKVTACGLGFALVVEGPRLLGIIAEADIRRSLSQREKFFFLKASDVMNSSPITILPDTLARDALEIMENRQRPLNFLPVADSQGCWKGVIRIHDLVSAL